MPYVNCETIVRVSLFSHPDSVRQMAPVHFPHLRLMLQCAFLVDSILSGNQNDGIRFTFNTINKQPHSCPVVINTLGTVDTVGKAMASRFYRKEKFRWEEPSGMGRMRLLIKRYPH